MSLSEKDELPPSTSFWCNLLTGGFAGCVAKTVIAPLDRTKINFQATSLPFNLKAMFRFLTKCYKEEGLFALWRGNTATLCRVFPYSAIQYSSHERYKHIIGIDRENCSHLSPYGLRFRRFLAGCGAGLTSVACTYPLDLTRAIMAVTKSDKYLNIAHATRTVYREEGLTALYRGFVPAMLGSIPYSGTAFFTFETLKDRSLSRKTELTGIKHKKLHPLENLFYGAFAGILGQTVSYPLDIVRRRMQTAGVTGHPEYCESITKTLYMVYKTEGVFHGLFKGVSMNWVKGPIASGISFTLFHQLQHLLHWWNG